VPHVPGKPLQPALRRPDRSSSVQRRSDTGSAAVDDQAITDAPGPALHARVADFYETPVSITPVVLLLNGSKCQDRVTSWPIPTQLIPIHKVRPERLTLPKGWQEHANIAIEGTQGFAISGDHDRASDEPLALGFKRPAAAGAFCTC